MNVQTTPDIDTAISELRARVACRVVTREDADYDSLRQIVYGGVEGHPASIRKENIPPAGA